MVDEPLALSAPLARRLARLHCRSDPVAGETCAWYHGFWQYLRLLGMGTSPAGHADFFGAAFGRLPPGKARILVAGGADYSMLAHAAAACRERALEVEFTMVDWCETPLTLSRWYAERESIQLQTERRDLLEGIGRAGFDAVCTHALLGHFRADARPRLIAALAGTLRAGGLLFLANRLRPAAPDAPATFSSEQVEQFTDTVARKASEAGGLPGIDAADLADAARRYAARQISWPVRSPEEMRSLFEGAGLRIEHLSCAPMGAGAGGLNVPTVAGSADYARVIAVK